MSFKREGDDPSQLNVLKKRRIADLLANYIPEDEALLLRNGRYACAVCFHRPVFDTLDMLTVHRSGKKHVTSLQMFYGKRRSLETEAQKRRQRDFLRAEETGAQVPPGPAPLLVQTKQIAQKALLKATPYSSCCRRNRTDGSGSSLGSSRIESAVPREAVAEQPSEEPLSSSQGGAGGHAGTEATPAVELPGFAGGRTGPQRKAAAKGKRTGKGKISAAKTPAQPDSLPSEKRQALEHYLRLRSSGWVQDGSGKWVKDENVEFDSDEDEPPPPPPS
uniref:Sodium channel modifier 1 n=1 Tax=Sphenodon punctatus TaxID=8508 RepID=A0A8D0G586_SPHPU